MKKALIGKKIGMTQFIKEDGTVVPVTVCELGPMCCCAEKNSGKRRIFSIEAGVSLI